VAAKHASVLGVSFVFCGCPSNPTRSKQAYLGNLSWRGDNSSLPDKMYKNRGGQMMHDDSYGRSGCLALRG
jgi:hypothetical protein